MQTVISPFDSYKHLFLVLRNGYNFKIITETVSRFHNMQTQ